MGAHWAQRCGAGDTEEENIELTVISEDFGMALLLPRLPEPQAWSPAPQNHPNATPVYHTDSLT